MASFNWSNEKTFNQGGRNREKLSDLVEVVEYPGPKKYGEYRFIGNPKGTAMHWISTLAKPKEGEKPGKKPRIVSFPKVCLGFDSETNEVDSSKCPYCEIGNPRIELRQNVIDRALQDNEPRNPKAPTKKESKLVEWNGGKFHLKDGKEGGGWTPVRVMTVIPAIGNALVEITGLNKHTVKGTKKEFGPDHRKYGFDVMVKYNKDSDSPNKMYLVQKGEIKPLTEDEANYLIWPLPDHVPEDEATAKKELKRMKPYICNREGELLFPDAAKGEKGGKSGKKNRYKDEFDEDEDMEDQDDDDSDDDDDDDDSSSKKSKSKSKKSKSSKNWDDDEDEDEDDDDVPWDEDDEDEDERPAKKSKKSSGKSSKSSSKVKTKSKGKLKIRR